MKNLVEAFYPSAVVAGFYFAAPILPTLLCLRRRLSSLLSKAAKGCATTTPFVSKPVDHRHFGRGFGKISSIVDTMTSWYLQPFQEGCNPLSSPDLAKICTGYFVNHALYQTLRPETCLSHS